MHDNTQFPSIESAGVHLSPGRRHKLGYTKKYAEFLSSPYTDCTSKVSRPMEILFETYQGADYAYSQTICIQLCTQAYT